MEVSQGFTPSRVLAMKWEKTGLIRRGNKLLIGRQSCESLAREYGTPLYVINETRVRDNIRRVIGVITELYEKTRVHYACKANPNLSVLSITKQEGCYIDAVSPGEIFLALKAGYKPEQISFTGNNVKNDELEFALKTRVKITVDSISQIGRLVELARGRKPSIAIRVNPEVGAGHHDHCITGGRDAKFGVWEEQAQEAARIAREAGVPVEGVHMHIGSGILQVDPFIPAIDRLIEIASRIQDEAGCELDFIDIGGGLGVPYKPEENELDIKAFASKVVEAFNVGREKYGINGDPYLALEPGRYIVADAVVLLTEINTVKRTPHRTFVGVDAGFNDLVRPAMYGSYHHILNASSMSGPKLKVDVAGPLCESGDLFARDREINDPKENDVLAILNAGAYGYSMSSQYNSRPRAAEVLVTNGRSELVRKRESFHSLVSGQDIPPHLRD
jgi:diaminopimelate decarboxylase